MNDVALLLAAIIAAVVLALGIYETRREHREAAMRDRSGIWHDSTSGELIDAYYASEQGIEATRTERPS